MEKFIHERIEFSFENNKLFFDTKLLNRGIYLKFLQFYFLDFSFVEVNLNAKNILIVFEASLVKILSYDLFVYRTIQKTLKRDIIYRNLQFKKI